MEGPPIKLPLMKYLTSCILLVLGTAVGCSDANGSGTGTSGEPVTERSAYVLSCTIGTLVLEIPIEPSYERARPYTAGDSADLMFSASVIFDEVASAELIEAGASKIDIISMEITTWVLGADPSMLETSWGAAPINDFDLEVDTDGNQMAGPHRIELDTVTSATSASEGSTQVELGLGLDGVSFLLGDFHVPNDCVNPTLVGISAVMPVEPPR